MAKKENKVNEDNKSTEIKVERKRFGRTPKYLEWVQGRGLELIKDWVRNGATDLEIYRNKVHVDSETWYRWKREFPQFNEALKNSREVVDAEVECALYKKATGFTVRVKKAIKCKEVYYDDKGRRCEREEPKIVEEDLYVAPDTLAQIFWLKNRRPEQWREKRVVDTTTQDIEDLTPLGEMLNVDK